MVEIVFAIFAHPDDEVLVAGTLMQKAAAGAEINLVVATDGEAGINAVGVADLGQTRLAEWQASGALVSARSMHALHFQDGHLQKTSADLTQAIQTTVLSQLATQSAPCSITLITFDTDGITGHTDHQAVTQSVTDVFRGLPATLPTHAALQSLLYCRLSHDQAAAGPVIPDYPLYGYDPASCDVCTDAAEFVARKRLAMNCHHTQTKDMQGWQHLDDELLAREYFREMVTGQES